MSIRDVQKKAIELAAQLTEIKAGSRQGVWVDIKNESDSNQRFLFESLEKAGYRGSRHDTTSDIAYVFISENSYRIYGSAATVGIKFNEVFEGYEVCVALAISNAYTRKNETVVVANSSPKDCTGGPHLVVEASGVGDKGNYKVYACVSCMKRAVNGEVDKIEMFSDREFVQVLLATLLDRYGLL